MDAIWLFVFVLGIWTCFLGARISELYLLPVIFGVTFALASIFSAIRLLNPLSLILKPESFIIEIDGKTVERLWVEVSEIKAYKRSRFFITTSNTVCYTPSEHEGAFRQRIGTGTRQLENDFGLGAKELARLMNQYRDAAIESTTNL